MELTPEQEDEILRLAVAGETITRICSQIGYSIWQMHRYREKYPTFDRKLTRAQMEGVEAQTDRLLTAHEDYKDPQKARVASDNIKWIAARRKPEVYGDRLDLNVTERVDVNGALLEARKRASLPACDQDALEGSQVAEYWEVGEDGTNGSEPRDSAQDDDGVDIFS